MSPSPKTHNRTSLALKNIAILARDLPQRLHTLKIKSESTNRRKLSCAYGERHKQIFPAGFDSTSSSSSAERSYYSFSPEGLYDVLTSGYSPEHHVEDIIVKSASYCKKTISPKHEFILLEVEDRSSPGLKNFIALDRNTSELPNRQTGRFTSIQSSQSFAAKDEFRVSYDGDKRKLLSQCDLQAHEILETLVFKIEEPLLLYQLATLTRAVSFQRDKYHVITANCYWFAGLIWDCMVRMRPSAYYKVAQGQIRGALLSWLRQSTNSAELEVTYEYVDKELLDIDKRFTTQKQASVGMVMNPAIIYTSAAQLWTRSHDMQLHDEVEVLRRRVRELEGRMNPSPDLYLH